MSKTPRKYSQAQNLATQKYIKTHYDTIAVRVPKGGKKEEYEKLYKKAGFKSLNSYIISLLERELNNMQL